MKIPIISSALNWAYQQVTHYTQTRPSATNLESTLSGYETAPSSTEQTTIWSMIKKVGRFFLSPFLTVFHRSTSARPETDESSGKENSFEVKDAFSLFTPRINYKTRVLVSLIDQYKEGLEAHSQQLIASITDETEKLQIEARFLEIKTLLQNPTYGLYLTATDTLKLVEHFDLITKEIELFENKDRENRFLQQSFVPSQIAPMVNYGIKQLDNFGKKSCFLLSAAIFFEEFPLFFQQFQPGPNQQNLNPAYRIPYRTTLQNYFAKFCEILAQIKGVDQIAIYKHLRSQVIHEDLQAFDYKVYTFLIDERFKYHIVNEFNKFLSDGLKVNNLILGLKLLSLSGRNSDTENFRFISNIASLLDNCSDAMRSHPHYQLLDAHFQRSF